MTQLVLAIDWTFDIASAFIGVVTTIVIGLMYYAIVEAFKEREEPEWIRRQYESFQQIPESNLTPSQQWSVRQAQQDPLE